MIHIWKSSAPGSIPTAWTSLDLIYGDRNCLILRFLAPDAQKEFQSPRRTRLLQIQLMNQQI